MTKRITKLMAALALLVSLAIPMGMWGQAPVGTTLWGETWTGGDANETPSAYGFEGTTVYGGATLTYAQSSTNTKLYEEALAGGESPELLLSKSNQTWTISNIPTGQATGMALTFKSNKTTFDVTSTTAGITISGSQKSWTIVATSSVTTFNLTIKNTGSSNARIDDIVLSVTTAGGDTPPPTTYTVTYDCNGGTSGCPQNVTGIEPNTQIQLADAPSKDGFDFDGWSDGNTTYGENEDYTVTDNVTFTAQWTENTTPTPGGTTATLNIQAYAEANSWTNATQYTTATVAPVTFTANGGSNTGKYYTNGQDWRFYQNESASITISVPEGFALVSVKPTYSVSNGGVLKNGNATIASGTTVNVSGTSVTFTVGNSGSATNGQVRFTNIDVVYVSDGGTQTASDLAITNESTDLTFDLYNNTTAQVISYTTSSTGAITITPAESDYFSYVHDATAMTITVTPSAVTPSAQTVTISQAADDDYYAGTATFTVSVANSDPNLPGTQNNPYTVAQARAAIDAGTGLTDVYATGIISQVDSYSSQYHSITYWISADGTTTSDQLEVYSGKGLNNSNFSSVNDVEVGATVVIYGTLKKYGDVYEFDKNNYLTSYTAPVHDVEIPTFSPAAGVYAETQTVTISCETEGTDIYYTLDGTDPTMESSMYENPITVSETTTIKAIAVNGDDVASNVASANYYFCSADDPYTVTEALAFQAYQYPANGIYVHGIVSTAPTQAPTNNGELTYYISVDGEATNQLEVYKGKGLEQAAFTAQDDLQVGDIVTVYGNVQVYNSTIEFATGNYLVEFERPTIVVPSVTVTPNIINAPAEGAEGNLALAYENITEFYSFDFYFCDAEGEELQEDPDWIDAEINPGADDTYILDYLIDANNGEARTAYMKVYTYDDDEEEVYAIVTINQAQYVIDYATLPFEYDGNGTGDLPNGFTVSGLGTYNSSPAMKFDGTGDYAILKFNERPGTLTFDIKGNGFSGGTFTVQTSEDGVTYTDLETYTELGDTQHESFANLGENVRYIKWIYTNKVSGNVGLGNIALAEYVEPVIVPSITFDPDVVDLDAAQHLTLQVPFTYENLEIEDYHSFTVQFYDTNNEPTTKPDWTFSASVTGTNDEGYNVTLAVISANEGEARSCYFKVYVGETYSNLVTINQAGAPQQYTLTVEPFENLELITFVNEEMVMEGDGEITVTEGDQIMLSIVALEGYVMETLMVNGVNHVNDIADDYTYTFEMPAENVTISATAVEDVPVTPGTWVLTDLADLTANDVFVIVGDNGDTYAMSNNKGTSAAPAAVAVTVVEGTLSGEPDANIQWNLEITNGGYIFYPNGSSDTWLYCTTGNNNNRLRVGTNTNNVFNLDAESGYLKYGGYYIGIYDSQDWRGYTSINTNIAGQTFAFYKKVDGPAGETFDLEITGWANETNPVDYYLIATPVEVNPAAVPGMVEGEYDLYSFLESGDENGNEWINYNQGVGNAPGFNKLEVGKGYLYAHPTDITLQFTGTPVAAETFDVELDRTSGAEFEGRNLVGNPFTVGAYIDREYYIMNSTGTNYVLKSSNDAIAPMTGIMVEAETDGETLTFSKTAPETPGQKVVMNVTSSRSNIVDRATIRFGEGRQLHKFMFNPNCTKLYIPQADEEFAVVRSSEEAEMPVNFKAAENGTYTISFSTEEVEMDYMHLIDNVTGDDIDLLATPSYTFVANTTDYANRFNLVFATTDGVNENSESHFAFYNGSSWVISNKGNATLQVVDMLGRVLSSESINGNATMSSANLSAGVYVMRLVNGNVVKTQKVVVK